MAEPDGLEKLSALVSMFPNDDDDGDDFEDNSAHDESNDTYYTAPEGHRRTTMSFLSCNDEKENEDIHDQTLRSDTPTKTPVQELRNSVRLVPLDFEIPPNEPNEDRPEKEKSSLIKAHFSDLSSSEDEFERHHDEQPSLNEPGRKLKKLLEKSRTSLADTSISSNRDIAQSASLPFPMTPSQLLAPTSTATQTTPDALRQKALATGAKIEQSASSKNEIYDPAFGISVKNPKVPLKTFNTYCWGHRKFKLTQLYPGQEPKGEWITMGVIVEKTEQRKSAKDNSYMIWQLHDLLNCQTPTVKVLVFGECLKEHWKLQESSVVAITQPQFIDNSNSVKDKKVVTLKLSKSVQVVHLGFCPDYGHCKGMKNDGTPCTMFVNTSKSSHCTYHIRQSAKKLAVRRGVFNTTYSQPPKNLSPRKFAHPPGLMTIKHTGLNQSVSHGASNLRKATNKSSANTVEIKKEEKKQLSDLIQSNPYLPGARNFLRLKTQGRHNADKHNSVDVNNLIQQSKSMKGFMRSQFQKEEVVVSSSQASGSGIVDLSKPSLSLSQKELTARQRAAAIMQKPKSDSKATNRKRPLVGLTSDEPTTSTSSAPAQQSIKKSRLGGGFTDDEIRKLLEHQSSHQNQIKEHEKAQEDQYFQGMEAREQVETHLTTMMERKNVKVVTCKKCKYTSDKQSNYCKVNGHVVLVHKADQRFYRCKSCKTRAVSYELMPTQPCKNCHTIDYERVALRDERKVLTEQEKLLVRGEERTFVNK